jgi:hypothetical protein
MHNKEQLFCQMFIKALNEKEMLGFAASSCMDETEPKNCLTNG